MRPAVLFDLGNTLAAYYHGSEFLAILQQSVTVLFEELSSRNLSNVSLEAAFESAQLENNEAADFRFRPMADRFERIFRISLAEDPALAHRLCELFLDPIFAIGRLYEDTLPTLKHLRSTGHPLAIVSNAPWGSPPTLWHDELQRLGLSELVDAVVMCGDVGWRKPARQIFDYAVATVNRSANQCIFVGDDLRWDTSGSEAVGMRSVLIDRERRHKGYNGPKVEDLDGLLEFLQKCA